MDLDRPLVQIRERSLLEILDLALVVIRRRPLTLGATAALGIAPWALLNAWLVGEAGEEAAPLHLALIVLEAPMATAPLTIVLGGLMFGERPRARAILGTLLRRSGVLLLFHVVLRFVVLVGCNWLLGWLLPAKFPFLNEVILLERAKVGQTFARCWALTSDRGLAMLGQWLALMGFGLLFVAAFAAATGQLVDALNNDLTWIRPEWEALFNARFFAGMWVVNAFGAVARFLIYIDQRIRLEGWEVELRLKSVGRAMLEELEAW